MHLAVFLRAALFAVSVRAFYYMNACRYDGTCAHDERRRQLEGRTDEDSGVLTLEIFERSHPVTPPSTDRAPRGLAGLTRKYARHQPSGTRGSESTLVRRANSYSVVPAAKPEEPNAVGIDQDGSDFAYFVRGYFGSEKKPMYLLLDTGAGTTWVMGSGCKSEPCGLHDSFGPENSKTYQPAGKTFSVGYGSGSVSGINVKDSISLAGVELSMAFGVADTTTDDFRHFPFDGIAGMSMAGTETDNFARELKKSGKLKSNVFSVYLNRNSTGPNTGELTLGGTNSKKYTGEISYTGVSPDGHGDWAIPTEDVAFDGQSAGVKGRLAYIDTGTSYIFSPKEDAQAFHKLVPGATSDDGVTYKVPCDTKKEMGFTFSGKRYSVLPQDWISATGDGSCTSNVYGREVVANGWLLGAAFLKNVYTVFDMDKPSIGFAAMAAPPPGSGPASSLVATPPASVSSIPSQGLVGGQGSSSLPGTADQTSGSASPTSPSSGERVRRGHACFAMMIITTLILLP